MEPLALQTLLPALTIAAVVFHSLTRSGLASALATATVVLAAGLARPYIKGAPNPQARNLRWLLALVLTLAFVLALDGWVYE
ncbi:hypothetical protein ACMC9I_09715 [Deinococcota bacterium DY0809b]